MHLRLSLIVRQPQVLYLARPRRDDYTICTAVVLDLVFTVLTYGGGLLYGPSLVRGSSFPEDQTNRSQHCTAGNSRILS